MPNRTTKERIGCLSVAILVISLVPMLIGSHKTQIYSSYIIFIYILLGGLIFSIRRGSLTLLSPNSLVFFYTTISLLLGSIAFRSGSVLVSRNLIDFSLHQHTGFALSFILVGLIAMPLVELAHPPVNPARQNPKSLSTSQLIALLIVTLPFLILEFDLSSLGGAGSLNIYIISLISIAIIYYSSEFRLITRYIIYLSTLMVLVFLFSHDKRIAVFLLITIAFLEARRNFIVLNFRSVLIFCVGISIAFLAIVVMSINRGYGGYIHDEGIIESSRYIVDYVKSDLFFSAFFQNIEVSYFFFHYFNSMELILGGHESLQYGSTLIKPLFLPFPREILPWKPDSIIDLYTMAHDPVFRSIGGSWPANFATEYMWNFHIFGIILFIPFAYFNARFYRWMVNFDENKSGYAFLFTLFIYQNILTYARGSGFDLAVFIVLVAGAFSFLSSTVHIVLFPGSASKKTSF